MASVAVRVGVETRRWGGFVVAVAAESINKEMGELSLVGLASVADSAPRNERFNGSLNSVY